jgi:hypothetical protein
MGKESSSKDKKQAERDELTCITPVGIAAFVHVWEPHAFPPKPGQQPKDPEYKLHLVYEDGTDISAIKRIVGRAIKKKWGEEKAKELLKKGKLNMPWRNASDYEEYGAPFDMEDAIMINPHSRNAPAIVNGRLQPITKEQDFYSGCKACCSVYAHAYESAGNMGVTLLLNNVQKTGTGDRLAGGRSNPQDEFSVIEGSDDDESGDSSDVDDLLG